MAKTFFVAHQHVYADEVFVAIHKCTDKTKNLCLFEIKRRLLPGIWLQRNNLK